MNSDFDWKVLAHCTYPVYSDMPGHRNDARDCGEPACYLVWWADDQSDSMVLCKEHFDAVKASEGIA